MTNHSLRGVAVSALQPTTSVWLQAANLCGLYREVSPSRDGCMCFAGYEEAITSDLDRYCAPCLPGTARERWSTGSCVACPDNETSIAPFLGMSGCICAAGTCCLL